MSNRKDQRTTIFYAVATFVALWVVTLVVWAITRPEAPAVAAELPQPAAQAAVVAAPQADPHPGVQTFERMELAEFRKQLDAGAITVIDVRSMEQYVASHIPGSLHIPVSLVQGEIPYLPKGKTIVTYCTCPAEESSGEAAMILTHGGMPAKALTGGLEAWTRAGYPVETGVK